MTIIRERFERALGALHDNILSMGSQVQDQIRLALQALQNLDLQMAQEVQIADNAVNQARFDIEEECFALIVTQQPAARDLRAIVSAMNIIVDLERIGDQAKGIAKVIPHLVKNPPADWPPELQRMGTLAVTMLHQAMLSYAHDNTDLARTLSNMDNEMDAMYASVFSQVMFQMAQAAHPERVEAAYELLRVARELERMGDLATNISERVIYVKTGRMTEMNVDRDDAVEQARGA